MKYLIYKGTGGLVHMLNGLQNAILLAKKENRILIIDTINTGAFKQTFNTYFHLYDEEIKYICSYDDIQEENKNDLIFEGIYIDDIQKSGTRLIDGKYYLANTKICIQETRGMKNKKLRVYAGYYPDFIKNLKLNNDILESIYEKTHPFIDTYKKYISVHFRNTDMKNNIQLFVEKIRTAYQKTNIKNIFLATDDYQALDHFKHSLPTLHFFTLFNVPNCEGKNIHYHYHDKKELVLHTLFDLYMIGKSSFFIPSINSGLSKWVIYQKEHISDNIFDEHFDFNVMK